MQAPRVTSTVTLSRADRRPAAHGGEILGGRQANAGGQLRQGWRMEVGFQSPGLRVSGHKQEERFRGILRIVPAHAHGDGETTFYEARYVQPNAARGRHLIAEMGFEKIAEIPVSGTEAALKARGSTVRVRAPPLPASTWRRVRRSAGEGWKARPRSLPERGPGGAVSPEGPVGREGPKRGGRSWASPCLVEGLGRP